MQNFPNLMDLKHLVPRNYLTRDEFIARWSVGIVEGGMMEEYQRQMLNDLRAHKSREDFIKEWTAVRFYHTRCPDCGQYTCVCPDDEQDDTCHCGHPECGAC